VARKGDNDGAELEPVLEFLRSVWALNHALERTSIRMESALGFTAQQRFVIRMIGRLPGVTPGRLAELLHVDPGSISAVLKRLEQRELVLRTPDLQDRRRVTLALTARGRKLDCPAAVSVEHGVQLALENTTAADLAAVRRVMGRLVAALEEISEAEGVGGRGG
jgi:DNA-binding MarR family transcriptional regulator